MVMGAVVGLLLMTGAEMVPKWAVLPVSAIAEWTKGGVSVVEVGGPGALVWIDGATLCRHNVGEDEDANNVLRVLSVALGFPPRQAPAPAGVAAEASLTLRRGRLKAMRSLPPTRFMTVAS